MRLLRSKTVSRMGKLFFESEDQVFIVSFGIASFHSPRIRKRWSCRVWSFHWDAIYSCDLHFNLTVYRNVSFKYPGAASYALQNVSFKILPGQLCVSVFYLRRCCFVSSSCFDYIQIIVGKNGSGKSTILKLVMRLYDVDEGQILVDRRDIRTLKLEDLRKATAVLFQDYTLFPLSVS
jgi:ABC-type multidrug transport system fused ATPase/permease subunit